MQNSLKKTTLPNGIRVLTRPDSHYSSALLAINIISGMRDEIPEKVGVTHLLEHMLFKRTKLKNTKEIANTIDSLGGAINAFTDADSLALHAEVPTSSFLVACDFLSELILAPDFDLADFNLEKEVVRQEILEATDRPEDLVVHKFHEIFWQDNVLAYPVFGSLESVDALCLDDIKKRYQEILKGSRIVISACGNFKEDDFLAFINEKFRHLEKGELAKYQKPKTKSLGLELIQKESQQVYLSLGKDWPSLNSDNRELAEIVATVLGGGMSSRFFQKLREEKGLVYDVDMDSESYLDSGIMMISAVVERSNLEESLEIIFEQLDQVVNLELSQEEFERARSMLLAQLEMAKSDLDNILWQAVESEMNFGEYHSIDDTIERYRSLEFSELSKFINNWLKNKTYLLVLGGDIENFQLAEELKERLSE